MPEYEKLRVFSDTGRLVFEGIYSDRMASMRNVSEMMGYTPDDQTVAKVTNGNNPVTFKMGEKYFRMEFS